MKYFTYLIFILFFIYCKANCTGPSTTYPLGKSSTCEEGEEEQNPLLAILLAGQQNQSTIIKFRSSAELGVLNITVGTTKITANVAQNSNRLFLPTNSVLYKIEDLSGNLLLNKLSYNFNSDLADGILIKESKQPVQGKCYLLNGETQKAEEQNCSGF